MLLTSKQLRLISPVREMLSRIENSKRFFPSLFFSFPFFPSSQILFPFLLYGHQSSKRPCSLVSMSISLSLSLSLIYIYTHTHTHTLTQPSHTHPHTHTHPRPTTGYISASGTFRIKRQKSPFWVLCFVPCEIYKGYSESVDITYPAGNMTVRFINLSVCSRFLLVNVLYFAAEAFVL